MPDIRFDTYYRHDDLSRLLQDFADEYPNLVRIESIGMSYEGRDIWLATVTNFASGPDDEKPALWVDGNIHASEVSPSSACLYFINALVTGYGDDRAITHVLDTRAYYICPRINPDGAEWTLADVPKIIRSSTRPYPYDEEPLGGLQEEDMDGDGRMLMMRIPDPNGGWKVSADESRLMVRRAPDETGGAYYRILPEGRIHDYDGVTIQMRRKKEGLDLNRNFPMEWRVEGEQTGAGPFAASEPEVHAVVQFIASHPNITGGVAFHTYGGVLLRPYSTHPDEDMPAEDLWTYQKIGEKGTELTGYPAASVYHDFRYHPKEVITGALDDLDVRSRRCLLLDCGDLEPATASRYHRLQVHRLVPGTPARRRSKIAQVERRAAPWQGLRELVSVRPSSTWRGRTRRMECTARLSQSTAQSPRARDCPFSRLAYLASGSLAKAGGL